MSSLRRSGAAIVLLTSLACSKENSVDARVQCDPSTLDCVPCTAGEWRCDGATLKTCQADGQGFDAVTVCTTEALCVKGLQQKQCAQPVCNTADTRCDGLVMRVCAPGQDVIVETPCPSAAACLAGLESGKCAAGECAVPTDCSGVETECRKRACKAGVCELDNVQAGTACENGTGACDGKGACGGVCTPGQVKGCADGKTETRCDGSGHWVDLACAAPLAECDHGACRGGAFLVWIPDGKGGTYGIDSTETTRDQYAAWLATAPATAGQIEACAWNSSYQPDPTCMSQSSVCQGTGCGNHPQVCIDWCDAYAYCRAMGKRMCGKIGGGPNAPYDYGASSQSQWYHACSAHGVTGFYYGETYDPTACNGPDYPADSTVPVGSLSGCRSWNTGYGGVFDLLGNVAEWEDGCSDHPYNPTCMLRGGSFSDSEPKQCAQGGEIHPNAHSEDFGIRCCAP